MPHSEKKNNLTIKYLLGVGVVLFLGYHSVYFKKLDEVKNVANKKFDAAAYAQKFFTSTLTPQLTNASGIQELIQLLTISKDQAFEKYAHATAVGSIKYFLVKGTGTITAINEDEVNLQVGNQSLTLATEFIYGNAIRDATGLFDITTFTNTTDINNVSAELNKIVKNKVIPPFRAKAKVGDNVVFTGVMELNSARLNLDNIEVIPISIQ